MNKTWQKFRVRQWLTVPVALWLTVLVSCIVPTRTPAQTMATGSAEAIIIISADMRAKSAYDQVNIHIVGSPDRPSLTRIARTLATKFHATLKDAAFKAGDPLFVPDKGIGLDFRLPVVPRREQYLPIAPFIEACAAHAAHLRMVYIIKGEFTYRGLQQYDQPDVSFFVGPPMMIQDHGTPVAFYDVDVKIRNQALTTVPAPNYPVVAPPSAPAPARRVPVVLLLFLAGVIAVGSGLVLVILILRWKAEEARGWTRRSTGDTHE